MRCEILGKKVVGRPDFRQYVQKGMVRDILHGCQCRWRSQGIDLFGKAVDFHSKAEILEKVEPKEPEIF